MSNIQSLAQQCRNRCRKLPPASRRSSVAFLVEVVSHGTALSEMYWSRDAARDGKSKARDVWAIMVAEGVFLA